MKLVSAEFVTSGVGTGGLPRDSLPQIALVGRSNVGKSSLINALCRRPIARTSAAPGKTRLANVYRVTMLGGPAGPGRHSLYLVDLPGYGYARGGSEGASELRSVAEAYLTGGRAESRGRRAGSADWPQAGSPIPHAVLQLVDSRHPGLASDLAAAAWLDRLGLTRHVVATKIDKLSRTARARNLRTLEERLARAALPVSATSGEGLDELWTLIARQPTRT